MNNNRSILVIDDEKGYRDFYKFALEPIGYNISTACDGEEGLRMALEKDYDVILLDVHMPKMRGPAVLTAIKKVKPKQIVVIFSSSSDPTFTFEKNAKDLGAFECLYKPVDLNDMIKVMDKALSSSGDKK
jgi:DNA-binding NtrC family response regulator